jgi:ubiquinone/menaquinone biosynthesis C-methylase UbiE
LDIGCNKGGDLYKIHQMGASQYIGVDCSEVATEEAMRRANKLPDTRMSVFIHTMNCATTALPCADRSVDVASIQFALQYFGDKTSFDAMMGEVARVLVPGGILIATYPDHDYMRTAMFNKCATLPDHMKLVGSVPSDKELHSNPWGNAYTFEYLHRTPPLREYVMYPWALEDALGALGMRVLRRVDPPRGSEMYTSLVAVREQLP